MLVKVIAGAELVGPILSGYLKCVVEC